MTEEKDPRSEQPDGRPDDEHETSAVGVEPGDEAERPDVEVEVEELRAELDQLNDQHLRLAAEFDNYRKRIDRDRQTLVARLRADLVSSLLDVVDDLERVAQSGEGTTAAALIDGVRLVEKKFRNVLDAAGLEPIEADDRVFDPATMEAMMTVPTDDPAEDGRVADVFQRGYRVGDVLVRPARVRVLSYEGPAGESE